MASIKLTLDTRRIKKDQTYPIKIHLSHRRQSINIDTGISIPEDYWMDGIIKRGCPNIKNVKLENAKLGVIYNDAFDCIEFLEKRGRLNIMTAKQIADYIKNGGQEKETNAEFIQYFKDFLATKNNDKTREKYENTLAALVKYQDGPIFFDEINKAWLYKFRDWRLETKKPNTVNIDLRNIRAAFNLAIHVDKIIDFNSYPFYKFDFAEVKERDIHLNIEQLKCIRDFKFKNRHLRITRDFFMLSFYLIGINNSDLYDVTGITDEGRLKYSRNKTHKDYSIKVEPEALEIINHRRGEEKFLIYSERFKNHDMLNRQMNKHLKTIAIQINEYLEEKEKRENIKIGFRIPTDLIMYYARHSWAVLAGKKPIGAHIGLVAQALGHGKKTVTNVYYREDNELVDDLNRKVLDLLR